MSNRFTRAMATRDAIRRQHAAATASGICQRCRAHCDYYGEEPTGDCDDPTCRFYPPERGES